MKVATRRRILWGLALALVSVGACGLLTRPLITRQGVNYRVTSYQIPAYVKAIDFLQRHYQYQLLVSRICAGATSEIDCVSAIFEWTHDNVPPTPEGWTVVDDHVTNIIIRRHGSSDQIADVFVTLTGYAGVPAVFRWITHPQGNAGLVLAFARLNEKWVMFDVERRLLFRDRDGQLADVHALVADPALVDLQSHGTLIKGHPYSSFVTNKTLLPFTVPSPLRSDMQQPWPRLGYEIKRAIGLESE